MNNQTYLKFVKLLLFTFFLFQFNFNFTNAQTCNSDITLSNQAEVDAFDCEHFEGALIVSGENITNLNALSSLKTITGSLTIQETRVTNLHGLENLTDIVVNENGNGSFIAIVSNPELENFDAMMNLSVLKDLIILGNPLIENINGFSSLPESLAYFILQNNDNIKNIDALSNIKSIDDIEIINNLNLENINGFQNLESISTLFMLSDALKITTLLPLSNVTTAKNIILSNTGITNLEGLGGINRLRGLFVDGNSNVVSLDGLNNQLEIFNRIAISDNPILTDINALDNNMNINPKWIFFINNPALSECCALYGPLNRNPNIILNIHDNGGMCSTYEEIINTCKPPTNLDLELSMSLSNSNPDIFSLFTQTITVTNTGTESVTDVYIDIRLAEGAVLEGGNEFDITAGAYNIFSDYWYLPQLEPGQSENIELHYFNLSEDEKIFWSQIDRMTSDVLDTDSTPGNGIYPESNEDDEAVIISGEAVNLPDLTISNLASSGVGSPGDVIEYSFDLNNIGTVESNGDYTISGYFSSDNILSNDDVWVGNVFTGNTPKGTIEDVSASLIIPETLPVGNYQFILVADVDQEVVEQKEDNNTTSIPFVVSNGEQELCMGDVVLSTQAEVDAFNCSSIDGDLTIDGEGITNLGALISLNSISGTLTIQNTNLVSLAGLNNVSTAKSLILMFNSNLKNLNELRKLTGEIEAFVITDNDQLENIDALSQMVVYNEIHIMGNDNLDNINGLVNTENLDVLEIIGNGKLQNLNGLGTLNIVNNMHITDNFSLLNLQGLNNLTQVSSQFVLSGNGIKDLTGLGRLQIVKDMIILNNQELRNLNALSGLVTIQETLAVTSNQRLSNFCGLYNLLTEGNLNELVVNLNASNPDAATIIEDCTPSENGSDLSLTMEIDAPSTPLWGFFKVTVTLTNSGTKEASSIRVHIPVPEGAVLEGGNEYECDPYLGSYDTWTTFEWSLVQLQPGQSTSIELNYFRLGENAVKFYAEVVGNNTPDTDSTPGNGTPPIPNEDDEVVASLNEVTEGLRKQKPEFTLSENGKTLLELILGNDDIQNFNSINLFPNPVSERLFISTEFTESIEATISIFDLSGRILKTQEIVFNQGLNSTNIDINGLGTGVYEVMITTPIANRVLKFVKM